MSQTVKAFNRLMDHLGASEDSMVELVREMIVDNAEQAMWADALEAAGVDNWVGFDEAREIFEEWVEDDSE